MMTVFTLLLSCSLAAAPIAKPCAEQDTECLLRQTLRLAYDLEAEKQKNAHLQSANDALRQGALAAEEHGLPPSVYFMGGLVTGAALVILTLIAVK